MKVSGKLVHQHVLVTTTLKSLIVVHSLAYWLHIIVCCDYRRLQSQKLSSLAAKDCRKKEQSSSGTVYWWNGLWALYCFQYCIGNQFIIFFHANSFYRQRKSKKLIISDTIKIKIERVSSNANFSIFGYYAAFANRNTCLERPLKKVFLYPNSEYLRYEFYASILSDILRKT